MHLSPQDLGERLNREVQQERVVAYKGGTGQTTSHAAVLWALGTATLAAMCWAIHAYVTAMLAGAGTVYALGSYAVAALRAADAAEGIRGSLTSDELKDARQRAQDPLVQSYLSLADSVLALPVTKDAAAEREVREAILALGAALEALPPEQKVATDDPAALREEAQNQAAGAQEEADAVIAASLRRRAESLRGRADTAARTILLLRRNQALREEVGEQMRALRTSLTALQVGGRQSAPQLSGLAASIQRVALEANAVTIARDEVDTLLSRPEVETARPAETEARVRISQ